MAKRRSKQDSGLGLLLLIVSLIAIAIVYLSILSSSLLILCWLYCEYIAFKNGAVQFKDYSEFELTQEETAKINIFKERILPLDVELKNLRDDISNMKNNKKAIFEQGKAQGVKLRNDGLFDSRSAKGQQLNQDIKEISNKIKALEDDKSKILSKVKNLEHEIYIVQNLVTIRFREYCSYLLSWIKGKSYQKALRYSVASYILIAAVCMAISPSWLLGLSKWLNKSSGVNVLLGIETLYGSMFISCLFSAIIMWQANEISTSKLREQIMPDQWDGQMYKENW